MKHILLHIVALLTITTFLPAPFAMADDSVDDGAAEQEVIESQADKTTWHSAIQKKYSYTDEQMKTLTDSGLNYSQLAKVSQLSFKSEKPLEEVLKMRTEQKMGWGKIAKDLGVHPSEIGKGTASLKHDINAERKGNREVKMQKHAEKREAKMNRKQEHRAMRAEKKANKRAGKKK